MPFRILFVSDSLTVSGAEHVLFSHLKLLQAQGHTASVYYRASNLRMARALEPYAIRTHPTKSFSDQLVRTTWRPDHLGHFAVRFRRVRDELRAIIAEEHIDLVHTVMYPAALYVALAVRGTGVPQIWHEHGVKRVHAVNAPIYRFVASTCASVIGPSNAVTGALAAAGLHAPLLRTVYNGIDLTRFARASDRAPAVRADLGAAADTRLVGLFGQLLPHKGHHLFIEAARAVIDAVPAARFVIVGALENPPYEAELRADLAARGLTDRFVFTGWRADVPDVMAAMDVVVVPTLTPEPAALSLMEAMALGRALVASNTGGTPELVVDGVTGLLFESGHAGQLASRVVQALTEPGLAERLGRAGRSRMEGRFTEARHQEEVAALYAAAIARRERPAPDVR
jgi:glycosyltransferase involved in cell wall biosynthesis